MSSSVSSRRRGSRGAAAAIMPRASRPRRGTAPARCAPTALAPSGITPDGGAGDAADLLRDGEQHGVVGMLLRVVAEEDRGLRAARGCAADGALQVARGALRGRAHRLRRRLARRRQVATGTAAASTLARLAAGGHAARRGREQRLLLARRRARHRRTDFPPAQARRGSAARAKVDRPGDGAEIDWRDDGGRYGAEPAREAGGEVELRGRCGAAAAAPGIPRP